MTFSHAPLKPLAAGALLGAVAALGLTLGAGCGSYKSPGDKLRDTAWRFNESVRWRRFSVAAQALPADRRGAWLEAMERTAGALRVLEFDMTPVRVGSKRALIQVDLVYVRASDPVVHRQRRQQIWRYDDGRWTLEADHEVQPTRRPRASAPARLPDFVSGDALQVSPPTGSNGPPTQL